MNLIKKSVAHYAASLVQDQQIIGLGSGTTATLFIHELGKRCQQGLRIKGVASSIAIEKEACQARIPLINLDDVDYIDATYDGVDAINPQKEMIKGRGGALLREKILAYASREYIIMIEEYKKVLQFDQICLPVEIVPFGKEHTLKRIEKLGYRSSWRVTGSQELFLTDNNNYMLDLVIDAVFSEQKNQELLAVPGVVDTGFFSILPHKVIVGTRKGKIEVQ
ncbi:MAG: ribose-5-phosphate isomerase RpiA [Parachlamydiales bacterium]|nr:ribose-5-phosphate isomerase RpiA [Parachlamydiales bacterium]